MLSPAEFVWMIRSFDSCAARKEHDAAYRKIAARDVRQPRNAGLFVIFVLPLFSEKLSSEARSRDMSLHGRQARAISASLQIQRPSTSTTRGRPVRRTAGRRRDEDRRQPAPP